MYIRRSILAFSSLLGTGCTSDNVYFQRVVAIPPLPHIAPGDDTQLHITWDESGDLTRMTVQEQ